MERHALCAMLFVALRPQYRTEALIVCMGWHFENARDTFGRHRGLWDEINRTLGDHILLDSVFVELAIRNFSSAKTLLGIRSDGSKRGIALVEPVRQGFWRTFQPSQAPLGLILLGSGGDITGQVHDLIHRLPGYALGLAVLQQDPNFGYFGDVVGPEAERLHYITTSRLTVSGSFEDYWKTRSHNLRHNLARQRRRIAEQGGCLNLVTRRDPRDASEEIRLYGELERAGWKGREGSAVMASNVQGRFYTELLEHFCRRSEGVVYRLDRNGTPIASSLCLERNATLMVLKITYDERWSQYSPGLLLHEEMLKALFGEKRIKVIEYYGRYSDWHRKWTAETRDMYHVNVYRHRYVMMARRLLKLGTRSSLDVLPAVNTHEGRKDLHS